MKMSMLICLNMNVVLVRYNALCLFFMLITRTGTITRLGQSIRPFVHMDEKRFAYQKIKLDTCTCHQHF